MQENNARVVKKRVPPLVKNQDKNTDTNKAAEAERGKNEHVEYCELVDESEIDRDEKNDTRKQSNLDVLKEKLEIEEDIKQ